MSIIIRQWDDNEEVQFLQEYLRIRSEHPHPNYRGCSDFLKKQAKRLGLPISTYYPANKENPVFIMTWKGQNPSLSSILLNSHMDVVPVFEENWIHPPFGAEIDIEGRIFARGAQDMKSVGMQYLSAIYALKKEDKTFQRTIHISFVPDEEMGGRFGMRPFVKTDDFKALNVGLSLDEGLASPSSVYPVFYAERSVWRIIFNITGNAGHGSLLLRNTVGEKLNYLMIKLMEKRQSELHRLDTNSNLTIGDVTTINLTRIYGGIQSNVVPALLTACFDCRLAIDVDHDAFEAQLHKWCDETGGGITIEYEQKRPKVTPTVIDDTNPYWVTMKEVFKKLGLKIKTEIFTGGTDSRYIRELGIPAFGFSPMNHTPVLLHDHNEFVKAETFLYGIEIYKALISKLADMPRHENDPEPNPDDLPRTSGDSVNENRESTISVNEEQAHNANRSNDAKGIRRVSNLFKRDANK